MGVWHEPSRKSKRARSAVTSANAFGQVNPPTSLLTMLPRFVSGTAICTASAPCPTADGIISASIGVNSISNPRRLIPATARMIAS